MMIKVIDMQDAVKQWKASGKKITLVAFMDSGDYVKHYLN
jgi:hypothetical protein